jgi:ribosomal protein S18 acetylase RimI-like enzyme
LADQLLQALNVRLAAAGVSLAQVLLPSADHEDARRLLRCGYQHAADLLYLVSFLQREPSAKPSRELEFEPYRESQRDRLAALIERTYAGTRDIPALDGQRDMEDVLEGYRQTGEFDASRWRFVRAGGEDVGCMLLADHPPLQQWELVYMGIVPEARGNGWGAEVTAQAQRLAREAGRERLVLAVDAANDPAISAYSQAGFVEWLRRAALMKSFSASPKPAKT